MRQLAAQERRYTCIQRQDVCDSVETGMMDIDEAAPESLRPHHFLSSSPNNAINLAEYTFQHQGDPAFKVHVRHSNLSTMSLSPAYLSVISRISSQGLKTTFFHDY